MFAFISIATAKDVWLTNMQPFLDIYSIGLFFFPNISVEMSGWIINVKAALKYSYIFIANRLEGWRHVHVYQ